jgi:osmotically-inducible protein OsmY
MASDAQIRDDVISELAWDPQVPDAEGIGVNVSDGAVTLAGRTPTYAAKLAAARVAERVYGVRAVADDLEVHLGGDPRDDSDIARAIAHVLEWNTQIPAGNVQATVRSGWVSLKGWVDYDHQRREVERMTRHVRGVTGISDLITVTPPVSAANIEDRIEEAFKRQAQVDARQVRAEVSDRTVRLYGHVHTLSEASAARAAAAVAPGIAAVEDHLTVTP